MNLQTLKLIYWIVILLNVAGLVLQATSQSPLVFLNAVAIGFLQTNLERLP